ncbi:hypothetical protein B296_00058438, partial [Ensete ventricosum]
MDRRLPGGTAKNRPSAVDFGRQQPIEGEIDCRQSIEGEIGSIEGEKGKKKKRKKRKKKRRRRKPSVVAARGSPVFSPARGYGTSPCTGRKDRGN